ncbi:MAG: hypothetical protein ACRCZU_04065 [Selenomonadaceae bacterium]
MTNEELQQAIAWFENRLSSAVMPGAREMFGIALSALREKLERDNPKPLTLSIEAAADAIDLIERHGGCPPNKDCAEKQDCRKCYIEWLTSRLAPKEAQS